MMRVTEDTPPDQLAGRMSLQALLPNGEVVQVQTERSTPMMDLLIQVCTKVRLQPSGHVLQALGSSPDSPVLQCHPNTPIGTLDTQSLKVLPKSMLRTNTMGKDSLYDKNKAYGGKIANFAQRVGNFNNLLGGNRNKNTEGNREVVKTTTVKQNTAIPLRKKVLPSFGRNGNIPKSQPFQTTFRLTVNLPRNQLYVVRVSPAVMLDDILQMVCAEKGLNYTKYEFRHPDDIQQQLPLNVQLGALGLSELTLVNSVTSSTGEASHTDSHSHSSDQSERVGLSSVNTHRLSRSHSALNTLHKEPAFQSQLSLSSQSSQETRRMDTPPGESPRLVPLTGDFPRPKPPARKRRPAPKPPLTINSATINEDDINYTDRDVITDLSQSTEKPDGVQQRMTYLVLSPSHSRSSSDSSGYHEPSVLSEGPSKTPPGTKTTVVAAPPRKKKAPAPPRPPQQQEPDSVKPSLRQSSIVDVTAEHTTVITNQILSPKAPPLPVSCAPAPNQPNPQAITVEASVDPPSNDAAETRHSQHRESVSSQSSLTSPSPPTVSVSLQDGFVNLNSDSGTKEVRPKESETIHTAGNQLDPIICPSPPPDWTYTLPAPPTPFADRAIVFAADGTAGRDTFTERDSMMFFPSRSISHDNITLMSDNMTVVSDITTVSDSIITPVIKQIVSVGENLYRNGSDIDSERDDSTLVSVESSCFTDPNTDLDFDSGQVSLESLQKRQSRCVERELCNLKEPAGMDEVDFVKNDKAHPCSKRTSTESRSSLMGELQELLKAGQSTQILQRSTSHVGISAKTANTLPNFKLTTYDKSSGINIFEDDTMRSSSNYEKKNTILDNVFKKPLDSVVLRKNHNNTLNFNNNYIRNRHSDILRSESFNDTTALHLSNSITNMDTINKEINGFHEEETERRRSSVKRSVSHASLYDKNGGWDLQSLQVMRTILPKLSPPHSPEEDKEEPKMNTGLTMSESSEHRRPPLAGPVESSDANGQMKESMKDTTFNSIIKENRSRNEGHDNIQKEKYASVTNINMNVKETEPVLEEVKSKEIYCESENVRKPWTYTGPPGIKLSTWSERPKSLVSLKSDRDYKMGGLSTALPNRQSFPGNAEVKSNYEGNAETKRANERSKEALTMRLISHAAPLKNQTPSVISPSSPKTQFKTIESNICTEVPKVQSDLSNLRESMHNDKVSRVPIVRAVELKKGFQLPTKDFHNINNSLTPPISGLNARTFFKSSESINVSNIDSNPVMRVASFKQPETRSFIKSPVVKGFRFADSKIEDLNKNITLGAQDNVTLRKPITMSHIQSQSVPNSTPFSQNSLKRTGYKDRMYSSSDANTENNRLSLPAKLAPAKMQPETIRNADTKMAPPPPQMPVVRGVKLKIPVITRQNAVENQRGQLLDSIRSFGKANLRKID